MRKRFFIKRIYLAAVQLCAALALWLAAATAGRAEFNGEYPYKAATTVGMVYDLVRNIAGDKADAANIIGAGVDPHLYMPTSRDVNQLRRADIIFYSGLQLEGKMSDVFVSVARRRPVYAVTELIDPQYIINNPASGHVDPHVWMDVSGWIKAAEAVTQALSEFDPQNAELYKKNGAALLEQLRQLDQYAKKTIASIPESSRVMVTAHDAFNYMGRAYGIEVHGIQGISTESEAGVQDINRLVELLATRKIPAIFVESTIAPRNIQALIEGAQARGHTVKIGGELFSDAMGPFGTYEGTYIGMIDHNVTVLARALGGEAPDGGMQGKLTYWKTHERGNAP